MLLGLELESSSGFNGQLLLEFYLNLNFMCLEILILGNGLQFLFILLLFIKTGAKKNEPHIYRE